MNNLIIESSQFSPQINMNASSGIISMAGNSYPENTYEFYQPVMDWIEKYFFSIAQQKTIVNMEINYFNSSSSKLFFDFFDILYEQKEQHKIEINWIYDKENSSAFEAGEDFVEDFEKLNINLVAKA